MTDPITPFDEAFAPARAAPARPKVYVLVIDHRHGSDVSVYATQEAAAASIEAYCREWWAQEVRGADSIGRRRRRPIQRSANRRRQTRLRLFRCRR